MSGKRRPIISNKAPKLVGKYKQVRVTFVGASFLAREQSTPNEQVDEALGLFILDEVFRRQSILSRVKGLIRKVHHCRKCDADLMGLKARGRKFSLDISYKQLPPFKLEIEMPAIPCPECGTSNAVNEENTEFIISGAIAKAFEQSRSEGKVKK
ncbi:MAG TPA: hypothetical protein VID27_18245, partial [Blastocatellia bacterium]